MAHISQVKYSSRNRFHRSTLYSPTSGSSLWETCPMLAILQDPAVGWVYEENWQDYDAAATTGSWLLTQATAGTAAIATGETGALTLDAGSTTSGQGCQIQRLKNVIVPVAGQKVWAEWRIKVTNETKIQFFAGLAESDTSIIAAAALSTANHIGWKCVTSDGVLLFCGAKASAATTAAATTLAASTYVKLGFVLDGVSSLQQYINGTATGTALTSTNIPIVALYPSFVCQSHGTSQPTMTLSKFRIAALYEK